LQQFLEFSDIFGFGRYLQLTSNIFPDACDPQGSIRVNLDVIFLW